MSEYADQVERRTAELRREQDRIAEARGWSADTARLDWFIAHSSAVVMQRGDGRWAVYFGCQPSTPWFDSPRAAIDAAMRAKPE